MHTTRSLLAVLTAFAVGSELLIPAQEARVTSVARQGNQLTIAWRGPVGWSHVLQYSPRLPATEWTEVRSVPTAPELNERTIPVPVGQPQGFYRVAFMPPAAGLGPRLFFTDLESGPNTGGQDNLGAFVAVYGEGLGAQRGTSTVTVGGSEVARYVIWGENNGARQMDKLVVQLGPAAASGPRRDQSRHMGL